jgi:hypothetical protein
MNVITIIFIIFKFAQGRGSNSMVFVVVVDAVIANTLHRSHICSDDANWTIEL